MTVKIKRIAKVADVSHSTVSPALHEHPAIAPNIIHIKQHSENPGYVPHAVARGPKPIAPMRSLSFLVALTTPSLSGILQVMDDEVQAAHHI